MKRRLLCLALICFLLAGCAARIPDETAGTTLPNAAEGTSESAQREELGLSAVPVCPAELDIAENSGYQMAETENGCYLEYRGLLYYADKSDLSTWVVVCNQPGCRHVDCDAVVGEMGFYLSDGRIYCLHSVPGRETALDVQAAVYSMALDGTDSQVEYAIEQFPDSSSLNYSGLCGKAGFYVSYSTMDRDGSFDRGILAMNRDGVHSLYTQKGEEQIPVGLYSELFFSGLRGDEAVRASLLAGADWDSRRYRPSPEGFTEIPNLADYDDTGGFLKGDGLFRFVANDGYYYTDLPSGKSVKRMDAQLEDSIAFHFGSDFLVETNMKDFSAPENPSLLLYRQGTWESVNLPEGFWNGDHQGVSVLGASESHLFVVVCYLDWDRPQDATWSLYAVDLTAQTLSAQHCITLSQ